MNWSWQHGNNTYIYGTACVLGSVTALYILRRYIRGPKCLSKNRLDGKVVIITGANTGIGKETAIDLAKRGAIVIIACRDEKKGVAALSDIREISKNSNVFLIMLNLASLESIKKFTESFLKEYGRLDVLVNNAGVFACPYAKTEDGFEMQFGTNHLGHFALTNLLLPCLKASAPSRIINVSSSGHVFANPLNFDDLQSEKSYDSLQAYFQSKVANIMFTRELERKLHYAGVYAFAVHPGYVDTALQRHSTFLRCCHYLGTGLLTKSAEYGAQTTINCAVQEDIAKDSGMYFADCRTVASSKASRDAGVAKKLWEVSEELTGVKYPF